MIVDVGLFLCYYFVVFFMICVVELLDNGGKDLVLEIVCFWKSRIMKLIEGDYVIIGF